MNNGRPIRDIFHDALSLINDKAADYSEPTDPHSNFKYADLIAAPFPEQYKPYAVLIGIKLARLSQLLQPDRVTKNESILDSFSDAINYTALMAERYKVDAEE